MKIIKITRVVPIVITDCKGDQSIRQCTNEATFQVPDSMVITEVFLTHIYDELSEKRR